MKVLFVREGFAHNSSSNHGVIKKIDLNNSIFGYTDDYDYQSDTFVLSNKEDKSKYILTQIVLFIKNKYISDSLIISTNSEINKKIKQLIKNSIVKDFFNFPNINTEFDIDHQSIWNFPLPLLYNNESELSSLIDEHFLYDLINYLLSDDIYIVGGHDSVPLEHYFKTDVVYLANYLKSYGKIFSRKDDTGNWVLSNVDNGDVIVVNFNNDNVNDTKLSIPYLVDLNITDQCTNGCEFCYRSCNANGNYVKSTDISNIMDFLHYSGVTEFVIGGGDITLHPEMRFLFSTFKKYKTSCTLHYKSFINIVENGLIVKYMKSFKAIAISLSDADEETIIKINNIIENLKEYSYQKKFSLQFIAELTTFERLKFIFSKCKNNPINILGYKDFGKGVDYKENNKLTIIDEKYIDEILNYSSISCDTILNSSISCDAIFANRYKDILLKKDASEIHLAKQDGLCTCFYDAVGGFIQPSSYSNEKFKLNINNYLVRNSWINRDKKDKFKNKLKSIFKKF